MGGLERNNQGYRIYILGGGVGDTDVGRGW